MTSSDGSALRLDAWLWRARFFKTRSLCAKFIAGSGVRVTRAGDTQRVDKPAALVRPGDTIVMQIGPRLRIIDVVDVGVRRGPASEARLLYEDRSPPPPRADESGGRIGPRPTKRDRRAMERFDPQYGETD